MLLLRMGGFRKMLQSIDAATESVAVNLGAGRRLQKSFLGREVPG